MVRQGGELGRIERETGKRKTKRGNIIVAKNMKSSQCSPLYISFIMAGGIPVGTSAIAGEQA